MNYLLRTLFAATLTLGIGGIGLGCEINTGKDKDESEEDDDDKKKKKKKKKGDDDDDDDDDDDKKKKKKKAKNKDDDDDIDVASLLSESSDSSGVLSKTDLKGIDTSKAPRLGKKTAASAKGFSDAEWLVLPGGKLQIAKPKGWLKQKEDNLGIIASPDKKAFILFTTYNDQKQLETIMTKIGEALKIKTVDWKKPKEVQLGEDGVPALVRGGALTTSEGEKGSILFALCETGSPEKVLALALAEDDVSKATKDQALNVILATRKAR